MRRQLLADAGALVGFVKVSLSEEHFRQERSRRRDVVRFAHPFESVEVATELGLGCLQVPPRGSRPGPNRTRSSRRGTSTRAPRVSLGSRGTTSSTRRCCRASPADARVRPRGALAACGRPSPPQGAVGSARSPPAPESGQRARNSPATRSPGRPSPFRRPQIALVPLAHTMPSGPSRHVATPVVEVSDRSDYQG
jgi:hypothetical protein